MFTNKTYIAIDLKSFYASVECVERGLDPLTTNLLVADESRTDKTICLAVSPALKAYGIPGRIRLFDAKEKVAQVNSSRAMAAPGGKLIGSSYFDAELKADPKLAVDFIIASPRMAKYMQVSTQIYDIYLRFVSEEDMHIYSVDEVFIDATSYLKLYNISAREFAMKMIRAVLSETGITATAGIGSNLYLSKIAMDIEAKHIPADENGVRIAELDEMSYRRKLWEHKPLTDFWRLGKGINKKLLKYELHTMGDIARCSLGAREDFYNEDLLYKLFGVNAELLIDHAWGRETATIADIKAYRPRNNSLSVGQVLSEPYTKDKARIIIREMIEGLVLDIVEKRLVTDQVVLMIGYDRENATKAGEDIATDYYGRPAPKPSHSGVNLQGYTSKSTEIVAETVELFDRLANPEYTIRRMSVACCHIITERQAQKDLTHQINMFEYLEEVESAKAMDEEQDSEEKIFAKEGLGGGDERAIQDAVLEIRKKYGKNAIMKATSLQEGATGISRNAQIGGHKA